MVMLQEIEKLSNKLHELQTNFWIHNDLFTYQWWIIVIANAVFFALLLFLMDRRRIFQIALAYMICYFIVCVSDDIGVYYGRWSYPHQLVPFTSELDTVDFAVAPVTITLVYQMFNSWRSYLIVESIAAVIFNFMGIPLFIYLGIIKFNNWNYFYSFLVFIVLGILVKIIMDFITRKDHYLKQLDPNDRKFAFSFFQPKRKAR